MVDLNKPKKILYEAIVLTEKRLLYIFQSISFNTSHYTHTLNSEKTKKLS